MDRRTLLKIGGRALIGAGLSGCAVRSRSVVRPPLRLAPVRAEWDRIIRTTVGLRPHRPSGFLLAVDRLDDTTVIHNYGHGGAGMSLSWGTGRMAAELALAHDSRRAAVIGGYGVSWLESYALGARAPRAPGQGEGDEEPLLPAHLRTGTTLLGPGEHPFPTRYASRRIQMRIEPSIYLDALVRDVVEFGGRIVIRRFAEPRQLTELDESLVINCTGLGARDLLGDDELVPLKGQLTVLVPQPEVDYGTFGGLPGSSRDGGLGIHMQPRRDGIVLGGTSERGEWSLEPDQEAMKRIVDAHGAVFSAMRS